ncbi:MAG: hypothetical protein WCA96_14115 [Methylocella sp.]
MERQIWVERKCPIDEVPTSVEVVNDKSEYKAGPGQRDGVILTQLHSFPSKPLSLDNIP